jgi:hypothetical protein
MTSGPRLRPNRYAVQVTCTQSDQHHGIVTVVIDNQGDVWQQYEYDKGWIKLPSLPDN